MRKLDYGNIFMFIIMFTICLIATIIMALSVKGYSTYGAPSEFGNLTTTTCYVGGDNGIVNCTGDAYFTNVYATISGTVNSSEYWNDLRYPSDLNYKINLSKDNITDEDWIEDSELPLANRTLPYCGNVTGATSNLCTLIDTTIGNCSVDQSCTNILYTTDESSLNANSSDYWDNLGSPSDLNNGITLSWSNMTSGTATVNLVTNADIEIEGGGLCLDTGGCSVTAGNFEIENGSFCIDSDGSLACSADTGDIWMYDGTFKVMSAGSYTCTYATADGEACVEYDIESGGKIYSDDGFVGDLDCSNITNAASDLCTVADTTIGNCSVDQSCTNILYATDEDWIKDSELPLANRTLPYCGNVTGATSDLCTLVDTTIGNCSVDQSCTNILYSTDESSLNANSSDYWDNLGSPSDLNYKINLSKDNITDEDWIEDTQEGDLNVNSSDFWDNLNVSTDLNSLLTIPCGNVSGATSNLCTLIDTTIGNCSVDQSCTNILYTTDESSLNANSSDYWDNLGSPSDLNNGITLSWSNMTSGTATVNLVTNADIEIEGGGLCLDTGGCSVSPGNFEIENGSFCIDSDGSLDCTADTGDIWMYDGTLKVMSGGSYTCTYATADGEACVEYDIESGGKIYSDDGFVGDLDCSNITNAASDLCTLVDTHTTNCSVDQSCATVLYTTDEANLNVNSSNFWNDFNVSTDLNNKLTLSQENITNEDWIEDSELPLANRTLPYCGNITGATSDLCTLVDTHTTNCSVDQSCATVLYTTDEANLNVNSSDFWDNLNVSTDLNSLLTIPCGNVSGATSNLCTLIDTTIGNCSVDQSCTNILYTTDESSLNANSSNYWDNLNVPTDLNNKLTLSWSNMTSGTATVNLVTNADIEIEGGGLCLDTATCAVSPGNFEIENGSFCIDSDGSLDCTADTGDIWMYDGTFKVMSGGSYTCTYATADGDACIESDLEAGSNVYVGTTLYTNDIGSAADEIQDIYIEDNKKVYLGNGQNGEIYYDGSKLVLKVN